MVVVATTETDPPACESADSATALGVLVAPAESVEVSVLEHADRIRVEVARRLKRAIFVVVMCST
jgi:hypothetical protein